MTKPFLRLTLFCFYVTHILAFPEIAQAQSYAAGACAASTVNTCVDSTPCKSISGQNVCLAGVSGPSGALYLTQSCWDSQSTYACSQNTPTLSNSCQALVNQGCAILSSACSAGIAGACSDYTDTYQCGPAPAATAGTNCQTTAVCAQGNCWNTPTTPNTAFGAVVTDMEIVREASVYDSNGNIFSGASNSCTYGDFGLKNCCKATSGALNNKQVLNPAGSGVAGFVGNQAISVAGSAAWYYAKPLAQQGSQYAYDFMSSAATTVQQGIQAMIGNGGQAGSQAITQTATTDIMDGSVSEGAAAGSSGFGAMGFSYGATAVEGVEAGTTVSGAGALGGPLTSLGNGFAFDPTSLAISVAIMVAMKVYSALTSCTQNEMTLDMNIGANLCIPVGSYCSKTYPLIGCFEYTEGYCCYNSILAKIINQQGRGQLGEGFGSPQNPDCSGFTVAQIGQLNFASMDFSQFIASINPDIPSASTLGQTVSARITTNMASGQGTGPGTFNSAITPAQ